MDAEEIAEPRAAGPRAPGFFRRHPVLTIAGAATVGLIGGVELALGVALGAGIAALVAPRPARGAGRLERAPDELRRRARAVIDAARGRSAEADVRSR